MSTPNGSVLFLYTESALHVGSGGSTGAIDLPIQRDCVTELPIVRASGFKGALREGFGPGEAVNTFFGSPPPDLQKEDEANQTNTDNTHWSSAVHLGDAELVLFPVRVARGGWAWVTSPGAIQRLNRSLESLGINADVPSFDSLNNPDAYVSEESIITIQSGGKQHVIVEDFEYIARPMPKVKKLAKWLTDHAFPQSTVYQPFRDRLVGQLMVISDTELKELATQYTEVATRVRIDPATGTVVKGALWTEESLPAETLFSVRVWYQRSRTPGVDKTAKQVKADFEERFSKPKRMRLGGNQSTGRGLVAVHLYSGAGS